MWKCINDIQFLQFVVYHCMAEATKIVKDWWSQNRIDYVVQEPDSVSNLGKMTMSARAVVLHSRYWEAKEMISFIVQTVSLKSTMPPTSFNSKQALWLSLLLLSQCFTFSRFCGMNLCPSVNIVHNHILLLFCLHYLMKTG